MNQLRAGAGTSLAVMEGGSGANIVLASSPQLVDGEVGLQEARGSREDGRRALRLQAAAGNRGDNLPGRKLQLHGLTMTPGP